MTAEEIMQLDEVTGLVTESRYAARIAELDRLSADVAMASDRLCEAVEERELAEATLRDAKRQLAEAEAAMSMEAYAAGYVNGANQSQHDTQIAGYVQGRTGARRTALSQAEMALTHATISRDQAETQWKAIAYQLQAQQAIVALLTK
jgi:hypothetical protein